MTLDRTENAPVSKARLALGIFFSLVLAGIGAVGVLEGLTRGLPLAFGVLIGACFAALAVWNVATVRRSTEYPQGYWLLCLSALAVVSGIVGLAERLWGLGALILVLGGLGLHKGFRQVRADQ